jgi:putative transcriptional regulator
MPRIEIAVRAGWPRRPTSDPCVKLTRSAMTHVPALVDEFGTLVSDYVLGALPQDQRRRMEDAVKDSAELRQMVDEAKETLAAVAAHALTPVTPRPDLRARMLSGLDSGDRFRLFFAELSQLLALPVAAVRTLLAKVDDPSGWKKIFAGISMFEFNPGAGALGTQANILRLRPGVTFPRHQHLGAELGFVLEGAGHDEDGQIYGPGAAIPHQEGTSHTFHAGQNRDLVLVVLHNGVKLLG